MDAITATQRIEPDAPRQRLTLFLSPDLIQHLRRRAATQIGRPSMSVVVSELIRSDRRQQEPEGAK